MGEVRFMISEAAKKVHVEAHVLRYWEDELDLKIGRTEMGHRYYTEDDIQLFRCIQKLKDEGVMLKDLKPMIHELTIAKGKLAETKEDSSLPANVTANDLSKKGVAKKEVASADVIPVTQLEQVRNLIGDVLTEVVTENNKTLESSISKKVTRDVLREVDFLFQANERQEEEHYRKLDTLIRQQQTLRKEASKDNPLTRLRKILT